MAKRPLASYSVKPFRWADILPPPKNWGGVLTNDKLPKVPRQIDFDAGKPYEWPIRNTIVHWATLIKSNRPGKYDLRCRTIDANGSAQPMPRPFPKSDSNTIQQVSVTVKK